MRRSPAAAGEKVAFLPASFGFEFLGEQKWAFLSEKDVIKIKVWIRIAIKIIIPISIFRRGEAICAFSQNTIASA